MTEATDKSNPRTRMTRHCPSTTTPSGAALVRTFCKLLGERKPGAKIAAPAVSTRQNGEEPVPLDDPAHSVTDELWLGQNGSAHATRLRFSTKIDTAAITIRPWIIH